MSRIVLFGATGYTGRLTAEALVARGHRPLLAARSRERLSALAGELEGEVDTATADVERQGSIEALLEPGDVLVTTVGPFVKWGAAAARAAIARGAQYIDSTGEPPFIREVFERYGPEAAAAGTGMLTAFGYDWVPGNLAGALALEEAGPSAARVDMGYFAPGSPSPSGGTRASLVGVIGEPGFAFRDGTLHTVRSADRYRTFPVRGRDMGAVTVGSSEHFALPRAHHGLREVNVYLGWFGPLARPMQAFSLAGAGVMRIPGVRALTASLADRFVSGSTGGPGPEKRAKSGSHIVGEAYDAGGCKLSEVHLAGLDVYTFTANILAWGAERTAAGELRGSGALGPVDGFGLAELEAGCREAGIARV